eukprot:239393-Pelagomonas_calceolata.AAC.9
MAQPFIQQASVQDVSDFLMQHNNTFFPVVFELMDINAHNIMLTGEDQSQADQPNSLTEGPPIVRRAQEIISKGKAAAKACADQDDSRGRFYLHNFPPVTLIAIDSSKSTNQAINQ